jgi:hypothetical protein
MSETRLKDAVRTESPPQQRMTPSREVRRLLASCLAGLGERATHVLVADPSYGATYDDLDTTFRTVRAGAKLVATQVNRLAHRDDGEHLDPGRWPPHSLAAVANVYKAGI